MARRPLWRSPDRRVAAGVVAYVFQQQFLFPVAEIDPVFWVLAGVLVVTTARRERTSRVPGGRVTAGALAALAAAALVAGLLDVVADHRARQALDLSAAPGEPESYGAAVERIDAALEVSPGDPILRARRASFLLDRARASGEAAHLNEAIEAWGALVEQDPTHLQHLLELGVALVLAGEADGAETAWVAAEDLAPRSAVPATNLALLYLETGRLDQAEAALRRGLEIDPSSEALLQLQARLGERTAP